MQVLVATKTRFQIFHIAALRFYESDVVQVLTPPARASHAYALPLLSYLHMRVCPRSTVRLCMRMRVYGHVCMYACMHARGGSCSRCTGPSLFLPLRRFSSLALVFLCVRAHFLPFACAAVPSLQCVEFLLTSMYSNLSVEKKTGNIHGGVPSFPHLIL